jgi:hypothetical protein
VRGREKDHPVVVTDVEARVLRRAAPARGWFNTWNGCGGVIDVRRLHANLSQDPVDQRWIANGDQIVEAPVLRVTDSDIEVISVEASAQDAPPEVIHWVIDLYYSVGAEVGRLEIDAGESPFQLTTPATVKNSPEYEYVDSTQGLRRTPEPGPRANSIC